MAILETQRLILRPWQESDADSLYEYAKDPAVGPIAGWPPHRSREDSLYVIRNVFTGPECYAICPKETGTPVGAIELKLNGHTDMTERDDECEVGCWLGVPFWGRGFVPEAGCELLRHAFEDLNMIAVWYGWYEGNDKSRRVSEKLGFEFQHKTEGLDVPLLNEVRTGYCSKLTKEKWLQYRARIPSEAEMKQIRGYVDAAGMLTALLVKRGKKRVALSYIASRIPAGKVYTEQQFNALLNGLHTFSDPATLRRELFDAWLVNRSSDGREYTLNPERPTVEELLK